MLDKPKSGDVLATIAAATIALPGTATAIGPYSLELPRAKISSIVGPSGSGKTTLVRAIVDRRQPLSGTIVIDANPAEVAYVPQNVSDRLNGMASALRHMRDVSPGLDAREAADLLERFRVPADALRRLTGTYSVGQQQRLVLLMALLRRPKLVILDEPTSALDIEMRRELGLILRRLADEDGVTVLVTTHHLPFVSVISDRVWRLSRTDAEADA